MRSTYGQTFRNLLGVKYCDDPLEEFPVDHWFRFAGRAAAGQAAGGVAGQAAG